jgi:NAD(P)-dependent dehydrogenase (short-subunit alcohol dehydrogenase family)
MARILITGANRGIGLALATLYKKRGDDVVAAVRTATPELVALGVTVHTGIDVTKDADLLRLLEAERGKPVDVLVANSGVLRNEGIDSLDAASIREQFEVNALGALRTVALLRPLLQKGSKVGLVTSRMGSVTDNTSGGMYGYRMSKAALNMAGMSLAHDLAPDGIAVALLHPGYVRTDMTGGNGHLTPTESAEGLIARLDGLDLQGTGKFLHQNGEELPW